MGIGKLSIVAVILLVSLSAAVAESAAAGALTVTGDDGALLQMPLEHTRVRIEVSGFVARAEIEQVFGNPFDETVEAVYTFPLGDLAAVDDFEMVVGERVVRGEIRRREDARRIYEEARAQGYRAALLDQERPNIFTQSVANIEPGARVRVRIRTFETLRYESGVYALTFPLVVGPRYAPDGCPTPGADRITPPAVEPGLRSGHDVEIDVVLDAGVPLGEIRSPSHRVEVRKDDSTRAVVRLAEDDRIPDKDFLLRWSVSADDPRLAVLAHRDGVDGFFTLLVQPKGAIEAAEAMPKEITLVLDTSGSMHGVPLAASKRFVERALTELGPRDTFNLVAFAGTAERLSGEPLFNEPASVERALEWLRGLDGRGGTRMLEGFRAAFARPADPERLRLVVFLTDGYIGNERQILSAIRDVVGEARIFTLGIGSAVNHFLLDRMADLGHGAYLFVRADENTERAVDSFRSWVTRPYLTDLEVDWGALPVLDVVPEQPRDLFSGQTFKVVGRYAGAGEGTVTVRGRLGGSYWEQTLDVRLPHHQQSHSALASLWARHRIEELLMRPGARSSRSVEAEVTSLALEFRLMSPFTSFVAVDGTEIVNPDGTPRRVEQALPLPEGVSFEGVFGSRGPQALSSDGEGGPDLRPEDRAAEVTRSGPLTESVQVVAKATVVDLAKARTSTRFSDDFADELPVSGRSYTNVLRVRGAAAPPPPPSRARTRVRKRVAAEPAVFGASGAGDETAPIAAARLLESSLRVLADLAEDGVLSPAEGRPALAGLLAAQTRDGVVAEEPFVHAVATWALLESAAALAKDPWVTQASALARSHLERLAAEDGRLDEETSRWAALVLGRAGTSQVPEAVIPPDDASEMFRRVLAAIDAAHTGSVPEGCGGRSPFDRLVNAIPRGHLKIVG